MTKSSKGISRTGHKKLFDVMIIGGGPGGMSALLWASQLGLRPILLECADRLGGQLHSIYNPISNYPGRTTKNGREMFRYFRRSLEGTEGLCRLNAHVISFDATSIIAKLDDDQLISAKAAIIATGVRRRRLGVPGETEFVGKGILQSGSKERRKVVGKRVAIVGGGDAALENALMLAEFAQKVYLIHRRDRFTGRQEFVESVLRNKRIDILFDSCLKSINGDKNVDSVTIWRCDGRQQEALSVDAVLIRIGVEPNSELVRRQLRLDKSGYILVNSRCETNFPKVFAIGDVANSISLTIATATGMGATAAKAISSLLNSSRPL